MNFQAFEPDRQAERGQLLDAPSYQFGRLYKAGLRKEGLMD